jgi:hypothetical protein
MVRRHGCWPLLILQQPERCDSDNARSHKSPAQSRPGQPSAAGRTDGGFDWLGRRQCQRHDVAAIAAAGEVLEYAGSLLLGRRPFRESRQHIRIGMIDNGRYRLQALAYDFGDVLHCSF